jgi:hypothetical protein
MDVLFVRFDTAWADNYHLNKSPFQGSFFIPKQRYSFTIFVFHLLSHNDMKLRSRSSLC